MNVDLRAMAAIKKSDLQDAFKELDKWKLHANQIYATKQDWDDIKNWGGDLGIIKEVMEL